jgi:hypothetical protein
MIIENKMHQTNQIPKGRNDYSKQNASNESNPDGMT